MARSLLPHSGHDTSSRRARVLMRFSVEAADRYAVWHVFPRGQGERGLHRLQSSSSRRHSAGHGEATTTRPPHRCAVPPSSRRMRALRGRSSYSMMGCAASLSKFDRLVSYLFLRATSRQAPHSPIFHFILTLIHTIAIKQSAMQDVLRVIALLLISETVRSLNSGICRSRHIRNAEFRGSPHDFLIINWDKRSSFLRNRLNQPFVAAPIARILESQIDLSGDI